ncbi:PspC domain-containing protein [Micromonospora sp. NPDC049559]|uniref:PspC domain-containing protein n=1 Tax=Micromonospora sp. NPDC049559 TaxID=3155923 RepID=UPI00343827A3
MTDDAAAHPGAQTTSGDSTVSAPGPGPVPSTPEPAAEARPGDAPPGDTRPADPPTGGAAPPPPPPPGPPPGWGYGPGAAPPPPTGAGFTSRYGLVRPRDGRYLAGVCAAIGRATNTDPVLWRVLLAVLGFFGGIGILVYVAAWLIIPGEGDTASPVESMLGRGRSSMSPVTVIVLSVLVAVSFGFIVTDAFRAVLLGAAILIGGAILLNRDAGRRDANADRTGAAPAGVAPGAPAAGGGFAAAAPGQPGPTTAFPAAPGAGHPGAGGFVAPAGARYAEPGRPASYPAAPGGYQQPEARGTAAAGQAGGGTAEPPTEPLPAWSALTTSPLPPAPGYGASGYGTPAYGTPGYGPPPGGAYRPPFAPRGPYAGTGPYPPGGAPVPPPAKPPKAPRNRERSPLGAATFSLIFLAIGVTAILDLGGVISVPVSGYFAVALTTIGLGLLVGTWFGRARWLIALGLAGAVALGIATLAESYEGVQGPDAPVVWTPTSYQELADRYENQFGDSTLDLRNVDFGGHETDISVQVNVGSLTILVPPRVDVTTETRVRAGDTDIFGTHWSGFDRTDRTATDYGSDGPGGGTLRLDLNVNAGNLEVRR